MNLKSTLTSLHLIEDENGIPSSPASRFVPGALVAPSPAPYQQPPYQQPSTYTQPISYGGIVGTVPDQDMVNKLKTEVLSASTIVAQFMRNVDIMRIQFPNDETTAMKAALGMTQVQKNALIDELNRTVSASLAHTKSNIANDRQRARDQAVGGFEKNLAAVNVDIKTTQDQLTQLQQDIVTKQANARDLQTKVQNAEADLQKQDDTVKASFAVVEQYVSLLSNTLGRL